MTTEFILLLTVFVFVIVGIFKTPTETFETAGPRLGYRIQKQIETGTEFSFKSRQLPNGVQWSKP